MIPEADGAGRAVASRLGVAAACCIVPTLIGLGVFDSRRMPTGELGPYTTFLLVGGAAAVLGAAAAILGGGWGRCPRAARWLLAGFVALIGWAMLSAGTHQQLAHDRISDQGTVAVPLAYMLVPLLSALVACVLGWVFAHGAPAARLPQLMAAAGWSMLAVVAVAVLRMGLQGQLGGRLNSAFAGAANLHVALLLAAACFAGLFLSGRRPVLHGVAAGAMLLALVATGSRTGVFLAAVFVLLVALRGRGRLRLVAVGAAVLGVALLLLALVVPEFGRLLSLSDGYRTRNLATGLAAWTSDVGTLILGVGDGVLWPWQAYENGLVPVVQGWDLITPWGPVLPSPHSTWLWALAELGLLGFGLLVALFVVLGKALWRPLPPIAWPLAVALALSAVALATDTYLVKNFPVAIVWWFSAFAAIQFAVYGDAPAEGSTA